jgi:hypothetical protein
MEFFFFRTRSVQLHLLSCSQEILNNLFSCFCSRSVQRQLSLGTHSLRRTSLSVRPHAPSSPRGRGTADGDNAGECPVWA